MILPSTLESARSWIRLALTAGGTAIDATVGNGHDTLFLAQLAGPAGRVFGFDIQAEAIEATRRRLRDAGQEQQVQLFRCSHHQMDKMLPEEIKGKVDAAMFNLGYLPHGNPAIITQPETTLHALQICTEWLAPGGLITLALYTGHPGGQEEADAVVHWASALCSRRFQVMWQQILNRRHAPSLLVIEKRS
ncbi:class I SAM-dependent methyltransferase [Lihuaxuella thermophila]|uniref:Putative rRNA methylase n=1 Tax=Lihuaxuella thermophila TaxID=1173111 RepID=A0A1H8C580_9BACL|nr:class I SAM-dependent methyltransferase [Lihuaxuella thermophila]SEM90216.1 Putative rRNA methylase [Lihuaxuella thermophila]